MGNAKVSLHTRESWWGGANASARARVSDEKPGWKPAVHPVDVMAMFSPEAFGGRLRILHLEDNAQDASLIRHVLESESIACEIDRVQTRRDFEAAMGRDRYDVVLCNDSLPAFNVRSDLQMVRQLLPDTTFCLVSDLVGEDRTVESLMPGAVDPLQRDHLSRLVSTVRRAYRDSQDREARLRIEKELRQRNELLRQITESVDDLIEVLDLSGRRIFISPSGARLFGDPQALIGSDAFANIHPDDREYVRRMFEESLLTGHGQRDEYRCITKDGDIRYMESQRSVVRDQTGKVDYVVVVSRDVTEREQAARKIREQAALLDQAPDAIFVNDLDQRITYWNQGAERVYGWSAAECVGKRASELFGPPDGTTGEEAWRTVFEAGDWMGELTHLTKAGGEITVASRHTLLRDARGESIAVLTINTDVTERKQLQTQLLRAQRVENIGALAGGIAHDLNNILAPVLMAADILMEQFPEGPVRQTLATIRQSAQRGSSLVNQILQFARGTKGEPVVLQLRHPVMDFSALIQDTFPRSIRIQTQVAHDLQLVMVDATQLHQVLLNLCVNARDAMPAGGELRIEAANIILDRRYFPGQPQPVSGPYVMLRVSDTGVGIPAPLLDKLFEPFFTTKVHGKGTGLGLSTVAKIVRRHRGFIHVSSQPGQGTSFEIYLPAATAAKSPDPVPSTSGVPIGQGEHILLVDDELAVLAITRELLEANRYQVTTARNGSDALNFFREHAQDIAAIVTDLMMPGLDGPSLIRAVKQIAPEARIVCISGLASEEKLAEVDPTAVRALLRKPYTAYDFLVTLRAALN